VRGFSGSRTLLVATGTATTKKRRPKEITYHRNPGEKEVVRNTVKQENEAQQLKQKK
jgi:hypothetical protein